MPRSAHSLRFQILNLASSTILSMLSVPAAARTVNGEGIRVTEGSGASLSGATILKYVGANGGAGVVVDANSKVSFWVGGTLTGNQPMDSDRGALNGIAGAPQLANIGITNRPNTYTGK